MTPMEKNIPIMSLICDSCDSFKKFGTRRRDDKIGFVTVKCHIVTFLSFKVSHIFVRITPILDYLTPISHVFV